MKKNSAFSLIELSIVILIVGIIIAGVTQSSSLIRKMRLSSARQLTSTSFDNAEQVGLGAYIDSTSLFTKAYVGKLIVYGLSLTTEEIKAV